KRKDPEETQPSGPTTNVADEALNEEKVPTPSNDPPLSRVNTLESGEDSLKLNELIELCTKLSDRVLNLEITKTAQAKKISKQAKEIVADKDLIDDITLAKALIEIKSTKLKADKVVIQEQEFDTATTTAVTTTRTRPKVKSIVMQEPSETPTTTTIPISSKVQDKGKGIMVEKTLKMKKKDQISFDEQEAKRLQAEIDEQDRLAEEKA
nr:hypothetical protein [Tanacetum cinerariifolium]